MRPSPIVGCDAYIAPRNVSEMLCSPPIAGCDAYIAPRNDDKMLRSPHKQPN
ncbi:MAG: hypothetical protein L6V93_19540 [Clostridiales bacterium]|nr:MAG: hypothetical protein L6V93_19540 [Clostridiales bacterium]